MRAYLNGARRRVPGLLAVALVAASPMLAAAGEGTGKTFAPVEDLDCPLEKMANGFEVVPGKDPNGWSFTLEPYLWAMATSGKVGVNGLPPAEISHSAKTILQHLDWGIMAKGEVRKGKWGLLGDGFFAQLSAGGDLPAPFYDNTSIKLQQGMASLALAYRLIDDRRGFVDVYAGARYNYMGINLTSSPDSEGIRTFSDAAAGRIVEGVGDQADAFLAQNGSAIADQVAGTVKDVLTTKALEKITSFPDGMNPGEAIRILNGIRNSSPEYRDLVAAVAEARVAAAKNQLTTAIQNRVSQAEKKLAKALSRAIEKNLPTSYDGAQWWVDPIVGLRAQVNFTRWLYLAAQGDVGGFGAGSTIAWNVEASLGVNFTRNVFAELGYRYFYMDYTNGGALYQAGQYGVFLGLGTRF